MIAFGIACFNFGVHLDKVGKIDAPKYVALIEKSLYESDYIERNSVVIDYDNSTSFVYDLDKQPELLGDGGGFPLPPFFELQFDIHIPRHIQEELNKELGFGFDIQKSIRVRIIETFYGPISFVHFESESNEDASRAVVLVREYLERHFADKSVYFEFLGPSPFHADFSISPNVAGSEPISSFDDNGFLCKSSPRMGYDQISFIYLPEMYATEQEALESLIDCLKPEISYAYLSDSLRVQQMHEWLEIDALYHELVDTTNKYDWYSRLKLILTPHSQLTHKLLHKLTSFEIMTVSQSTLLQTDYDSVYGVGLPTYLQNVIDKECRRKTEDYPTKQIIYFLEFHEKRFLQIWQTSILAVSALVGAVIGSVLTALTSSGH